MNESQLKSFLSEQVVFLRALDLVMPGNLDPDLIEFLENIQGNQWSISLLLTALSKVEKPQQVQNQTFKRAVG
jgi:hypothetical protein